MRRLLGPALRLLYPPTCVLCGAAGADGLDLCAGCRADLPVNRPCCPRCALPLPADYPAGLPCGRCQRHPPPFDHCQAPFRYEGPLPLLVGGFKFRTRLEQLRVCGEVLALHLMERRDIAQRDAAPADADWRPDAIVPVPLHPRRLRERGYNQALELARIVGRRLDLPVDPFCCVRARATPPQTTLGGALRRTNLRGAFVATRPLTGRRLVLLDDVVTTGATVTELSRVLRRAGCERVAVWALARTP